MQGNQVISGQQWHLPYLMFWVKGRPHVFVIVVNALPGNHQANLSWNEADNRSKMNQCCCGKGLAISSQCFREAGKEEIRANGILETTVHKMFPVFSHVQAGDKDMDSSACFLFHREMNLNNIQLVCYLLALHVKNEVLALSPALNCHYEISLFII